MAKEEKDFSQLVNEALENTRRDRDRILDAYEKMKIALNAADSEKTIMMGQTAVKLLEQLNKANEQIVRLAQIKEKQESKLGQKKDDSGPLDIDDIKNFVENNK